MVQRIQARSCSGTFPGETRSSGSENSLWRTWPRLKVWRGGKMFKCPAQRFCDSFFAWMVEFSRQLFLSRASFLPTMTLKHLSTSKRKHIESSDPRSHKTVSLYSCEFLPNSLRSHWFLRNHMTSNIETRISMFSLAPSRETVWLSGNKINCFPRDRSSSVFGLCSLSFQNREFS